MTAKEKPYIEQYLDAKYVTDNPSKFDLRDVSGAREFCDGFEKGKEYALQITIQAVGEARSKGLKIDGINLHGGMIDSILSRIKQLTND